MSTSLESLSRYLSPEILEGVKKVETVSDPRGLITLASHPFAPKYTTDDLLRIALTAGLPKSDLEAARSALASTGFTARYASVDYLAEHPPLEWVMNRSAAIGAHLLNLLMQARGWERIHILINTSAFLPEEIGRLVLEQAEINNGEVIGKSYRYACGGVISGYVDTLADESLKDGMNVAILALEPLSYLFDPRQLTSLDRIIMPGLFSDDFAALAFTTGQLKLVDAITRVEPDNGVIRIPTYYPFAEAPHDPNLVPSHYEFSEGGEAILRFSDRLAALMINRPNSDLRSTIDGLATAQHFKRTTSAVGKDLIRRNPDYSNIIRDGRLVMHPASRVVSRGVGLVWKAAGLVDDRELGFPMGEIERANSSSATTLVAWEDALRRGMTLDREFIVVASGIGSVNTAAIIRPGT